MDKLVITASSGSFSGLADELRKISVQAVERPLISSQPPDDWARLDEALNHRDRYGSLALTSPRAAAAVANRIRACGISWVGHTPESGRSERPPRRRSRACSDPSREVFPSRMPTWVQPSDSRR